MLKKNGFNVVSRWVYYASTVGSRRMAPEHHSLIENCLGFGRSNICNYLTNSPGYKLSGRRYVNSWRVYFLNGKTLRHFIEEQKIIMTDYPIPDGIALFNTHGYWHRSDVLQVMYLDSVSNSSIQDLVFFLTNLGNSLIKSP